MEALEQKVYRDEIYLGQVVSASFFSNDHEHIFAEINQTLRGILFTIDQYGYADDLLYASSAYPIINHKKERYYFPMGKHIIIPNAQSLGTLLQICGYDVYVSFQEMQEIKESLFTKGFIENYHELFGLVQDEKGVFVHKKDGLLPEELFSMIRDCQDNNLEAILKGEKTNLDSFKPSRLEGPIRKLKKW